MEDQKPNPLKTAITRLRNAYANVRTMSNKERNKLIGRIDKLEENLCLGKWKQAHIDECIEDKYIFKGNQMQAYYILLV